MSYFDHSEAPAALQIDETGKAYLLETARWGKFLGIMGFIFTGLMIVFALLMFAVGGMASSASSSFGGVLGGGLLGTIYLVVAIIYFFPSLKLFQFSTGMSKAIPTLNQELFTDSLGKLKSMMKIMGILTIIMIFMYVIGIIFAIVVGVFSSL